MYSLLHMVSASESLTVETVGLEVGTLRPLLPTVTLPVRPRGKDKLPLDLPVP